jgi:AcrR family transcriptional regulator
MHVRDQLLSAAARVYAEVGYHGATTRRIAVEAGVNEITLFRHFGSKDSLLREAISQAGWGTDAPALPDTPGDPLVELTAWAHWHFNALRARSGLIRTCMGETKERAGVLPFENSPPARAAKSLQRYLRQLRSAGLAVAPFDEGSAAAILMGTLFADSMGRDIMPDMFGTDPHEAVEEYVRLLLRAIGVTVPVQASRA